MIFVEDIVALGVAAAVVYFVGRFVITLLRGGKKVADTIEKKLDI